MRRRQRVIDARSNTRSWLKDLLAAEQLIIGVLDPALAQNLVGEVVHGLEDRQARHQPPRQRRLARVVGIDRAEPLFQKAPVDRPPSFASGWFRSTI
jgi:hypothetical protein